MKIVHRKPSAAELLDELLKREYQRGFDDGYELGESVRPLPVTDLGSRRALTLADGSTAHKLGEQIEF